VLSVSANVWGRVDVQDLVVDIDGSEARAVNYLDLSGPVSSGDEVVLNTTAVKLNLGTGGVHFVICNLTKQVSEIDLPPGHIMKLRYTPLQTAVLAEEEDDSPHQDAIRRFENLDGMPVICCELHSQIAPAAAAVKALSSYESRVVYVMTDGAALLLAFSNLAAELAAKDIIDATITCGQAFGGDIETVNLYTGLIAARQVFGADVAIVCQGPGNTGAGSKYGFSGIQQGEALNAAGILGGKPIAVPRISFADRRERHRGVSHHTLTVLAEIALSPSVIAIPELQGEKARKIEEQLAPILASSVHEAQVRSGEVGLVELAAKDVRVKTMGRTIEEDREFFLSPSAAGVLAAECLR